MDEVGTQATLEMCSGIEVGEDIFTHFPLTALPASIVVEHHGLHSFKCKEGKYLLHCGAATINPECESIKELIQKLISKMTDENLFKSTENHSQLSHHQLTQRIENYRGKLQQSQVAKLNAVKKYNSVSKTLNFHQRLLMLLKENNVPRLKSLIAVAVGSKRSIRYVIQQVVNAIDGIYLANPTDDDKDLALLIQQMGGPALLDIVHRAIGLPSNSTAYRLLKKTSYLNCALTVEPDDVLNNVKFDDTQPGFTRMLKIDETYVDNTISWNPRTNDIVGFCYEHTKEIDTKFDDVGKLERLCHLLDEGAIHQCGDSMAFCIASNNKVPCSQFCLLWPTCSKKATPAFVQMVAELSEAFHESTGKGFLCWASDGDGGRRITYNALMSYTLSSDHIPELYEKVKNMTLFDLNVGKYGESVDFDAKHLAKRMRTTIISDHWTIKTTVLTKSDIRKLLSHLTDVNQHSVSKLLDVDDKQNVPLASDLLLSFSDAVKNIEKHSPAVFLGFRMSSLKDVLKAFTFVIDGLLTLYCTKQLSLKEQLTKISTAMHVLLSLQRCSSIVPNVLYHDLMVTFENAFLVACKFQINDEDRPCYLMLCGTDPLERLFGNMRVKLGHNTVNHLGMVNAARSINACQNVLENHPDWNKKNYKRSWRVALDYSNPAEWDESKLTTAGLDIYECFLEGRIKAQSELLSVSVVDVLSKDYATLASSNCGITFQKPKGSMIGLRENCDIVIPTAADRSTSQGQVQPQGTTSDITPPGQPLESEPSSDNQVLAEFLEDPVTKHPTQLICEDGKYRFKASMVKSAFDGTKGSKDRLRRVRGLSRYIDSSEENVDLDDMLLIGDPIVALTSNTLCCVTKITVALQKVVQIQGSRLEDANVFLKAKPLKVRETDTELEWDGQLEDAEIDVAGKCCSLIQPTINENGKMSFSRSLVVDLGISFQMRTSGTVEPSTSRGSPDVGPPTLKCKLCTKSVPLKDMRIHVGHHILFSKLNTKYPCGFCGKEGCSAELMKTKKTSKMFSNCPYFVDIKRKSKTVSVRVPCLNYITECSHPNCTFTTWVYNMKNHFQDCHPSNDLEHLVEINAEEIERMRRYKK